MLSSNSRPHEVNKSSKRTATRRPFRTFALLTGRWVCGEAHCSTAEPHLLFHALEHWALQLLQTALESAVQEADTLERPQTQRPGQSV